MTAYVAGVPIYTDEQEVLSRLAGDTLIALDIETSGLNRWTDKIAVIQLYGDQSGTAGLLHIRGRKLSKALKAFLSRPDVMWVGHNLANFDCIFLHAAGVDTRATTYYDTLVGETVITTQQRKDIRFNLKDTLRRRLGIEVDKTVEHSWMNAELTDRQVEYAMNDVIHLPSLYREQYKKADDTDQVDFLNMEVKLTQVVIQMIINGLPISETALWEFINQQKQRIIELEDLIFNGDGYSPAIGQLNLGSTVQLRKALLAIGIKTDSTREEVMKTIKVMLLDSARDKDMRRVKLIDYIMEWRHCNQRVKMYNQGWWNSFVIDHGHSTRVHAQYRQSGTDTTRFSCGDPNMQQVPANMRQVFVARPGYKLVSADYSGIEIRVAAYLAHDTVMLEALKTEDIHTTVASLVYEIPASQVTKELRKLAKSMNFRLLFGGGVKGFYGEIKAEGSKLTYDETADAINRYFRRFAGLDKMKKAAYNLARGNDVVKIALASGARRYLTGSKLKPTTILNTPVQGNAGVGLKQSMIDLRQHGLDLYLVATVHDELVFEVPDNEVEWVTNRVREVMIAGMQKYIKAPIAVEVGVDQTWKKG